MVPVEVRQIPGQDGHLVGLAATIDGPGQAILGVPDIPLVGVQIELGVRTGNAQPGLFEEGVAGGDGLPTAAVVGRLLTLDGLTATADLDVAAEPHDLRALVVVGGVGGDPDGFVVPRGRGQGGLAQAQGSPPAIVPGQVPEQSCVHGGCILARGAGAGRPGCPGCRRRPLGRLRGGLRCRSGAGGGPWGGVRRGARAGPGRAGVLRRLGMGGRCHQAGGKDQGDARTQVRAAFVAGLKGGKVCWSAKGAAISCARHGWPRWGGLG